MWKYTTIPYLGGMSARLRNETSRGRGLTDVEGSVEPMDGWGNVCSQQGVLGPSTKMTSVIYVYLETRCSLLRYVVPAVCQPSNSRWALFLQRHLRHHLNIRK